MSKEIDLKEQFYNETGTKAINSQGEPDIDYVAWLESKVTQPYLSVERMPLPELPVKENKETEITSWREIELEKKIEIQNKEIMRLFNFVNHYWNRYCVAKDGSHCVGASMYRRAKDIVLDNKPILH